MSLIKLASEMRRAVRPLVESAAPAFRSGRAEVEKLVDALLSGAQVKARAQAVLGREGDMEALVTALRLALYPVVVHTLQQLGGKVSGSAGTQAAIRAMAREDVSGKDGPAVQLGEREEDLPSLVADLVRASKALSTYLDYGSGNMGQEKNAAFERLTKDASAVRKLVKEMEKDGKVFEDE